MRILYDSKSADHKRPFGTLREGEACDICVHIPAACKTVRAYLVIERDDGNPFASFAMEKSGESGPYEYFSCRFSLAVPGLYFYIFRIETADGSFDLFREGFDRTNMGAGDKWQLSCIPKDFDTPKTFVGGVMYQIFPDRFCRLGTTDLSEKLTPFTVHKSLSDTPEYRPNDAGEITNSDFFGGNLRGILSKLDYLSSLGVSVIYLNPIFKAYSNHRYDTCDYRRVDEMLGTDDDFRALCDGAHEHGMRVILDGVFSHTGNNSIYFDAHGIFGTGAVSNPVSPYRKWYNFEHYPDKYDCWWGIKTLPAVNENDPSYVDYQITSAGSTVEKWMRLGADGWRLDVADELPEEFIKALRDKEKELSPESLLIGEVWEDASNKVSYGYRRKYFTGGELDSVMNYPFRTAVLDYILGHDDGTRLRETVLGIIENYPACVVRVLMNFLSTHDTARALTVLSGAHFDSKDERARFRLSGNALECAKDRLRAAYLLIFALPGIPSVYYGDEIGMEGFEDPFCRGFFDWDKETDLPRFFAELASLRKIPAFAEGATDVKLPSPGVVVIVREGGGERYLTIVNRSDSAYDVPFEPCPIISEKCRLDMGAPAVLPGGFLVSKEII